MPLGLYVFCSSIRGCLFIIIKGQTGQGPVAHACNPSYSEGIAQEDLSLKPAWANSSVGPYLRKKTVHKKGLMERHKV
jgi:hypothetical protein